MANPTHILDSYPFKAFLDTNIVLEGRPLGDLPWEDIHPVGPIVVLVTPTAIKEVDAYKQDGRVGERARAFNRLIAPLATGGSPIVIREQNPRVVLALALIVRIPWNEYSDLDPADGDSRIVAEILNAKGMSSSGKLLVSHDIKPIIFASAYGISTLHVSDKWLRSPDPHPKERENQRLKDQLAQHENGQPSFDVKVELPAGQPLQAIRIADLSITERSHLLNRILAFNQKYSQFSGHGFMNAFDEFDEGYDRRYEEYQKIVSTYVSEYERHIEKLLNQTPLRIHVTNNGKIQAEHLLIEVCVSGGWVHDRYVIISPRGPAAPRPRANSILSPHFLRNLPSPPPRVGRHNFAFQKLPSKAENFSASCEDFRHGQSWSFDGVLGLDPRTTETKIIVSVTASNYRGIKTTAANVAKSLRSVDLIEIVNTDELRMNVKTPVDQLLKTEHFKTRIDWSEVENDDGESGEADDEMDPEGGTAF